MLERAPFGPSTEFVGRCTDFCCKLLYGCVLIALPSNHATQVPIPGQFLCVGVGDGACGHRCALVDSTPVYHRGRLLQDSRTVSIV